jgi:hypothetical protein
VTTVFRRLTSAWTDAHAALLTGGVLLSALSALAVSGSFTGLEVALTTVAVALATFMVASLTDTFGGMLVGLVGGASLTALHQYLPDARPLTFAMQAATLGLLFLLGMSTGLVADRMRRAHRITARTASHAIQPVEGSLGLLSSADAAVALTHELARAELHQRPLTTATVRMTVTDSSLGEEEVRRARRAVARSLETELRVTDLVFVDAEGHFGAILPETSATGAVDVVESALIVARNATFADRELGRRTPVAQVADLEVEVTPVVALGPTKTAPTRSASARPSRTNRPHSHKPTRHSDAATERAEAV